ncbi:hypothetical protein PCASD_26603 [Puccinia coronata f. sp. avenae]|uniref:Uncharacterized protein n=1 Tax=Puccinia coronata f. sp. avenae TaxID=200324 RepID=A0A2N5RWA6_9BASI|nr:hypothetical protein PCASD_26603 [Puccinia coronata f. sp. avenae]
MDSTRDGEVELSKTAFHRLHPSAVGLVQCLLVIFIQCEAILGIQVANCIDTSDNNLKKIVALCIYASQKDDYQNPNRYAVSRAMQAGTTATCDQILVGTTPPENMACCDSDFGVSTRYGDNSFTTKTKDDFDVHCNIVPSSEAA